MLDLKSKLRRVQSDDEVQFSFDFDKGCLLAFVAGRHPDSKPLLLKHGDILALMLEPGHARELGWDDTALVQYHGLDTDRESGKQVHEYGISLLTSSNLRLLTEFANYNFLVIQVCENVIPLRHPETGVLLSGVSRVH